MEEWSGRYRYTGSIPVTPICSSIWFSARQHRLSRLFNHKMNFGLNINWKSCVTDTSFVDTTASGLSCKGSIPLATIIGKKKGRIMFGILFVLFIVIFAGLSIFMLCSKERRKILLISLIDIAIMLLMDFAQILPFTRKRMVHGSLGLSVERYDIPMGLFVLYAVITVVFLVFLNIRVYSNIKTVEAWNNRKIYFIYYVCLGIMHMIARSIVGVLMMFNTVSKPVLVGRIYAVFMIAEPVIYLINTIVCYFHTNTLQEEV